jgi:hypothetical protein
LAGLRDREPWAILRRDGSQLAFPLPLARRVAGLAFSPDERRLAVATGTGVVVLRTSGVERFAAGGAAPHAIELPLAARDVAWR